MMKLLLPMEVHRYGKRDVERGSRMLTRKKSVDIPKYDDPLMVVLDVIIEYGKLHREWEKEELARLEKEKLADQERNQLQAV